MATPNKSRLRRLLTRNRQRAQRYLDDPAKLNDLLSQVQKKQKHTRLLPAPVANAAGSLAVMGRMLGAYAKRDYRAVPWGVLISAAASLLYFVMPWDAVPDFILGMGLVDDAALIAFIASQIKGEIDKFMLWEQGRPGARSVATISGEVQDRGIVEDVYLSGTPADPTAEDHAAADAIMAELARVDAELHAPPPARGAELPSPPATQSAAKRGWFRR